MQRKALATAVALGLAASTLTAPAASAATVGPRDAEGNCKIKLTDAEADALRSNSSKLDVNRFASDLASAIEKERPNLKSAADQFLKTPEVQKFVREQNAGDPSVETSINYLSALEEAVNAYPEQEAVVVETYFLVRLAPLLRSGTDSLFDFVQADQNVNSNDDLEPDYTQGRFIIDWLQEAPGSEKIAKHFAST